MRPENLVLDRTHKIDHVSRTACTSPEFFRIDGAETGRQGESYSEASEWQRHGCSNCQILHIDVPAVHVGAEPADACPGSQGIEDLSRMDPITR